jgi:hypothetical protein
MDRLYRSGRGNHGKFSGSALVHDLPGREVVDSAGDDWKARQQRARRAKEKRRRFFTERRSGWDRRARVATVSAFGQWPAAWPAAAR